MQYIKPKKIIYSSKNLQNLDNLLKDYPFQINLFQKDFVSFKDNDYVIFDFGKEVSGGIRLFTYFVSLNHDIRIRFGESIGEVNSDIGYKGATNDHSPRDIFVKVSNYSDLTFGQTGFRFVRIDFQGEFWNLRNVVGSIDTDTRKEEGYFVSNDPLLNKIWKTASYTLRLNLHNGLFWDGVKRDRLCWIGDSYPEMRAAMCLYKSTPEIINSIRFTYETTPVDGWLNFMPTYNLWAMFMIADNYKFDGNKDFVLENRDRILYDLKRFDALIDSNGETHLELNFLDWPSHYDGGDGEELIKKDDEIVGTNYFMQVTFKHIQELFTSIPDKEITDLCLKMIKKLNNAKLNVQKFKQIAAMGVLSGDSSKNNEEVLLRDGSKGLSTFQSYFLFIAISSYGHYEKALNMLKEYYGGMLKVGSTTFWEDFDVEWLNNASRLDKMPKKGQKDIHGDYGKFCYKGYRHSLCHGWSSGVIPYIVETIVGLKNIDSKTYKLEPHLSGLTNVKCKFPTPFGAIIIKHEMVGDTLKTDIIKCPKEIIIVKQ